jgi:hypothetical protein
VEFSWGNPPKARRQFQDKVTQVLYPTFEASSPARVLQSGNARNGLHDCESSGTEPRRARGGRIEWPQAGGAFSVGENRFPTPAPSRESCLAAALPKCEAQPFQCYSSVGLCHRAPEENASQGIVVFSRCPAFHSISVLGAELRFRPRPAPDGRTRQRKAGFHSNSYYAQHELELHLIAVFVGRSGEAVKFAVR